MSNYDKMVGPSDANVVIAIGRYYLDKEGNRFKTAAEAGEGYVAKAEVGVGLVCKPAEWPDDVKEAAMLHSFTRKAQEHFQAVKRSDGDFEAAAGEFPAVYAKLIKGERERAAGGGGARVDSTETMAIKYLANELKLRHTAGKLAGAKVPIIRLDDPPKTEKGQVNFIAWAKLQKEGGHPWYDIALKKVQPASDKDMQ